MARFLILWRTNLAAPWPTDASKAMKLNETMWAAIDKFKKEGVLEDFGFFPNATSGYAIGKGEATDVFARVNMFLPYMHGEVHEIIPYEKGKGILREVMTKIAAAQK